MNAIGINKVLLHALGRNPLPDFPEVKTFLAHETTPVTYPALIISSGIDAAEPYGNVTATITTQFVLVVNPEDYTSDSVAQMICDLDAQLASRMTTDNLNTHAEEIGCKEFFYFFRWNASAAPENDETHLSFTFTYSGSIQF